MSEKSDSRRIPIDNRQHFFFDFFDSFRLEHFLHKLAAFHYAEDEFDSIKEFPLTEAIKFENEDDFKVSMQAEVHFTYFQIVELLFELIFALETAEPDKIWRRMIESNWRKNYKRIEEISKGKHNFLQNPCHLSDGRIIPFVQYLFYGTFRFEHKISEIDQAKNFANVIRLLEIFARDFSDRGDYNAYKHGLRFMYSPFTFKLSSTEGEQVLEKKAKHALHYLDRSKNQIKQISKAFDYTRDSRLILLAYWLSSNIITVRKKNKKQNGINLNFFHIYTIKEILDSDSDLSRLEITIKPIYE